MSKHVTNMTIFDVDHYTDDERAEIISSWPPHERDARAKGIPQLGSGRIYEVSEELIVCQPFHLEDWVLFVNGMDFGIDHPFAAVQLAIDPEEQRIYVVNEYRVSDALPPVHAAAIKPWGDTVACAWPRDGHQRDKGTGLELRHHYRAQGLNMLPDPASWPDGSVSVEAGLLEINQLMATGQFKVFSRCEKLIEEIRLYHRKDGQIVKKGDDLCDAMRYAYMMRRHARVRHLRRSGGGMVIAQGPKVW